MRITEKEKTKTRAYTNKLIEGVGVGMFDPFKMLQNLLIWISEDEARDFALYYEYVTDAEDDSENE